MNKVDAQLRRYDAAPNIPLTPAESARAGELLTRIIDTPRAETLVARRIRRPLTLSLAGMAAAAAVAGAVVGTQAFGHGNSATQQPARITAAQLAAWTATPTHPAATSPAVRQAASACLKGAKGASDPEISNVDQRGDFLTLMATDPVSGQRWWCWDTPIGILEQSFVNGPGWPLSAKPADAAVSVQDLTGLGGSGGGRLSSIGGSFAIGVAYGQVGAGVTGVTLTTAAGEKVTATVQDGLWSLWWPGSLTRSGDNLNIDKATLTWKTADGISHTARAGSLDDGGIPVNPQTKQIIGLPPSAPGKPITRLSPYTYTYTGPNEQAKTPAAACAPDATHPAATMSNLVQSGGSFELICT
ncbi:MAG: hypothetical protein ACRDP7_22010, partial [Trebonia sp.]